MGNVKCSHHEIDIYQRVEANRRRLALAFIAAILIIFFASGIILFIIFRLAKIDSYFWPVLPVFWLCFLTYIILRYILGGRWIHKTVKTVKSSEIDPRLSAAFEAVMLASGMTQQIRLMIIGVPAINTFSISLPDGSYAIYATQGIADKLPQRERQALMAHEIAHIQMRDTLISSLLIRMLGRRTALNNTLPFFVSICFVISIAFLRASTLQASTGYSWYIWIVAAFFFLTFILLLPLIFQQAIQYALDKESDFFADIQAVYLIRDPEAVYRALRDTDADSCQLQLPPCFSSLLFNPVVVDRRDSILFTGIDQFRGIYQPSSVQPTMDQRIECLKKAFPQISV